MNTIKAILIGIGIWAVAVSFFTLSFEFQIMEDLNEQANIVLSTVIIPLVWLGSYLYYRKEHAPHGFYTGLTFFLVAAFLDAIITVPLFIIPNGGNHFTFYMDLGFWLIALEIMVIALSYYYIMIAHKTKNLNL